MKLGAKITVVKMEHVHKMLKSKEGVVSIWVIVFAIMAVLVLVFMVMFFVSVAYPGTAMYNNAVAEGMVEPRWWANQQWDSESHSAFEKRWGWTADGALKIPGFDAEFWQKRATRSFYFNLRFIWDTTLFTLKNPYFLKHLFNLGIELIPFHKIPLPWKKNANKHST